MDKNIDQNILFYISQKKESPSGLEQHEDEWILT